MSRLGDWLAGGLMISDGAWGTQLQVRGLQPGTTPDTWNLTHADHVESVARAYAEAGSQIILTNTFRANAVAMHDCSAAELDAINRAGVALSKSGAGKQSLVFASIGPSGKILMSGEVSGEQVSAAFVAQAESLAAAGADALLIETMSEIEEARLAVDAARRTGLPVLVTFAFDSGKSKDRTMMGATPEAVAAAMVRGRRGRGGHQLRRRRRTGGADLQTPARCLRNAHLDQAECRPSQDGRNRDSLRYDSRILRFVFRGFRGCGRVVCGRLLRLHAGVYSCAGCRASCQGLRF